jgi:hypothetical protein
MPSALAQGDCAVDLSGGVDAAEEEVMQDAKEDEPAAEKVPESRFGTINLRVAGRAVQADIEAELMVGDINRAMDEVAAKMAYWGALWGEAEAEQERVDAQYRFWSADFGRAILAADPKLAEWKVAQEVESSPKFARHKDAVAAAQRNVTVLKVVYESFRTKASILQSKGAMLRAELEATGMATKKHDEQEQARARAERVREAMKK